MSHASLSSTVSALLKKTEHYDKDERYMATSDLCELVKKHSSSHSDTIGSNIASSSAAAASSSSNSNNVVPLDAATERKICTTVLTLLHDKSPDVQAVAVKTLAVLLTTVQPEQVLEIADSLADKVLETSQSDLRDVYAMGLRKLVQTCPVAMGQRVAQRLMERLMQFVQQHGRYQQQQQAATSSGTDALISHANIHEITLACLDSLTDLLVRFGSTVPAVIRQHEAILLLCLDQLSASTSASLKGGGSGGALLVSGSSTVASSVAVVRKRAGHVLACLSVVLSDVLLSRLIQALLGQLEQTTTTAASNRTDDSSGSAAGDTDTRSVIVRTMCAVSAAVGHRLDQTQIDLILPLLLRFTQPKDALTGDDEDEDDDDEQRRLKDPDMVLNELRESCFIGLESFVVRCPAEVESHLDQIITAALAFMSYDPNYSYGTTADENDPDDENDDDDEEETDDYEDDDDDADDDDDDDDDDESWKVRRSAIRVLMAVVESKRHQPAVLWTTLYPMRGSSNGSSWPVAQALVQRFKEREENCRVGVMDCFSRLLAATVAAADVAANSHGSKLRFAGPDEMDSDSVTTIPLQKEYSPAIVKACQTILSVKKGNDRSKSNAFALLAILCRAPGGVGGQGDITSVLTHVKPFLVVEDSKSLHREGTSKALRLDALSLVHALLASHETHNPVHMRTSLSQTLLPELCQAVNEQWYKVIAEAVRALSEVPRVYSMGFEANTDPKIMQTERTAVANQLFKAIEPLLAAHDVDQEIKECALKACASLLSSLHSNMTPEQIGRLLSLLLDRLTNETTRMAAIKTLSSMASAESGCSLQPILAQSIAGLSSFLLLQNRGLKQSSLEALDIIVSNHGAAIDLADGELFTKVLEELALLVTDRDLHLSHLSLCVANSILLVCPTAAPAVKTHVLGPALVLSKSQVLQDHALDSLLAFFKQVIVSNVIDFDDVLVQLRQRLTLDVNKHGIYNLAKCIAVVVANTSPANRQKVVNEILTQLDTSSTPTDAETLLPVQLALIITGDIGRLVDLTTLEDAASRLNAIYVSYFESPSEDLKNAAAYALGNASVGAPATFLKAILGKLEDEDNKKQQYLLLSALREYIQCTSRVSSGGSGIETSLSVILSSLERHSSDEEEGVRTMVAECLGSLACLRPEVVLKHLESMYNAHASITALDFEIAPDDALSKENALVCWTVASAIKLSISGKVDASQLAHFMPTFVKLLHQDELNVRNAALLMVYSAVHHMPSAISDLMRESIMPSLYEVAKLKRERKVDLGPFTHTVDDALPHRKAALSIFATCLDNIPGSLDVAEFMPVLARALGDAEDIQLHAHQIVMSMCTRQPTSIASSLDSFVEPLEKTINKKPGQKSGTELERMNDWIKSALRVMLTLTKIDGSVNSPKWVEFVERVKLNPKFNAQISALDEER